MSSPRLSLPGISVSLWILKIKPIIIHFITTNDMKQRDLNTTKGSILMLVENAYPEDTRIRNEATLLTSAGYAVFVVALTSKGCPRFEEVEGVKVYRAPLLELFKKTASPNARKLSLHFLKIVSFLGYLVEYFYFTAVCFIICTYIFFRHGFDVIHAHNPPDTLFLVALPFKLVGKKFVFDHHDLCPELYQSRYRASEGFYTKILGFLEWCSLKTANITIATNESYKEIHVQRGRKPPDNVFIVRNGPNENKMRIAPPSERLLNMDKKILCYIGALNPQDGLDYLLRSLDHLLHKMNRDDFYCVIMGSGDSLEDLRQLSKDLNLEGHVELPGYISEEELTANLAAADICVDPDPSSPLNDLSTWIKIMEYMAYGKPIVSFDLKESMYSARDAALWVPANNEVAFAEAIANLMDDPAARERMGRYARKRVDKDLQWSVVGQNLLLAYKKLLN